MPNTTHPEHYAKRKIEPIHVIDELGLLPEFCLANAIKYLARWKSKGGVADLEKCLDYAKRLRGQRVLGMETLSEERVLEVAVEWEMTGWEAKILGWLLDHNSHQDDIEAWLIILISEVENQLFSTPDSWNWYLCTHRGHVMASKKGGAE